MQNVERWLNGTYVTVWGAANSKISAVREFRFIKLLVCLSGGRAASHLEAGRTCWVESTAHARSTRSPHHFFLFLTRPSHPCTTHVKMNLLTATSAFLALVAHVLIAATIATNYWLVYKPIPDATSRVPLNPLYNDTGLSDRSVRYRADHVGIWVACYKELVRR